MGSFNCQTMRYQPQYQVPHTRDALNRTSGIPKTDPGRGYASPSRANLLRQPGMPVLGTRHHEQMVGKHVATVRVAHDIIPVDTETDQRFFRETTDRTINVVETLGDQNRHLADCNIQLREQLAKVQKHMQSDDAEIQRFKGEFVQHFEVIDQLENMNDTTNKSLNEEREAHRLSTQKLTQVVRDLDHANEMIVELRTGVVADLEQRNAQLIEEVKREKNAATMASQRLAASEDRCAMLTNQNLKIQRSCDELTKDNNMLLAEKEAVKQTLAREQATFEDAIASDREACQAELNKIACTLQARLAEQNEAYRVLFEEHKQFQAHSFRTADEYKAFVDAQNDDIKRLQDLSNSQAGEIQSLFESEMASRRKFEAIEDTVFTTEERIGLTNVRSPIRNMITDDRLHNKFQGFQHQSDNMLNTGVRVQQERL